MLRFAFPPLAGGGHESGCDLASVLIEQEAIIETIERVADVERAWEP